MKRISPQQIIKLLNEEKFKDWLEKHDNQQQIIAKPRKTDGSAVYHFLQANIQNPTIHVNNVIIWESTENITHDDPLPVYLYLPEWAICITARTNQFCKGLNRATIEEILWLLTLCQEPYVWEDDLAEMPPEAPIWEL